MTHSHINAVLITALLIWAGACIGANMIAAPAKFQVADLTRPVALQVGRMQFQWVGYLEYLLAIIAALATLTATPRTRLMVGVAITLFIVQRLIILPQLSQRTNQIIAGTNPQGSSLHLYFILCELTKIIALMAGAILALSAMSLRTESI